MAGLFWSLVLIGLLASLLGPTILHYLDVKHCSDAGGTFNSDNGECEFTKAQQPQQ